MAEKVSFLTLAVQDAAKILDEVHEDLKVLAPAPFMQRRKTKRELLEEYQRMSRLDIANLVGQYGQEGLKYIDEMERLAQGGRMRKEY